MLAHIRGGLAEVQSVLSGTDMIADVSVKLLVPFSRRHATRVSDC